MKYVVEARFLGQYAVEVEARSEEEAEYEAMLAMVNHIEEDAEGFFEENIRWTVKEA